jgi:hypothetical protein
LSEWWGSDSWVNLITWHPGRYLPAEEKKRR